MRTQRISQTTLSILAGVVITLCFGQPAAASAARAQDAEPAPTSQETPPEASTLEEPSEPLTLEALQSYKDALEGNSSLSDAARAAALEETQRAFDALTRAAASSATAAQYRADATSAPERTGQIRQELATPLEQSLPVRPPDSTLADVQDRRDSAAAELAEAQGARDRIQATATRRSERRLAIDGELVAAQAKLDQLLAALEEPVSSEQDPAILDAKRQRLLAEIQEARAQLARLDAEQDRNQAEEQLISLRLDLARRHVRAAEAVQEAWDQILREGRSQEAEQAVRRAAESRTGLAQKYSGLRAVIENIDALSAELTGPDNVVARINAASEERSRLEKEYLRIRASYSDTLNRLRVGGSTQALGFLLRLEYDKLEDPSRLRIDSRRRQELLSEALYRKLVLDEHRGEFGDVGERVQELLAQEEETESLTEQERQAFIQAATELCTNERELAASLRRSYEEYAEILQRTETTAADLIALTELYEKFIRQHILWQRSVDRPFHLQPAVLLAGLEWIFIGGEGDLEALFQGLYQQAYLVALYGLVIALLFLARRKARARIVDFAPLVASYRTDSLLYTLKALLYTLVASLPFPVAVYGAGWLLELGGTDSQWRSSWAHAITAGAGYLLPMCLGLEILRKDGLARAHLRWPEEACRKLRHLVIELLVPFWLLAIAQRSLQVWGETPYRDTTGRMLFVTSVVILCVFCYRALSPHGAILKTYYTRHGDSLLSKTRGGLHVVGVALSASIVLMAVFGYFFTARVLVQGLAGTLILAFSVALMVGLANRWQVYHRRRLALAKALERRAEREAGGATEPEITDFTDDIDITSLDAKTRKLISTSAAAVLVVGLLSIWSDALPALRVLERVQILPTLEISPEHLNTAQWVVPGLTAEEPAAGDPPKVDGVSAPGAPAASAPRLPLPMMGMRPEAADATATSSTEDAYRLTAADILAALVVLLVTVIVVRDGPALLELGVLTSLNIDAGARYAITTLARYTLFTLGATLAFNALGVGWQSVQWLAAAMTFGLAFGLQEIFANFISGLILLLERPIRIGDTVTIGELTGTVGRIRPRATTILDFDNRERLIPNKTLITDEVINWTLSSAVTRLVASVGVAYGSNTHLVFENLMRAAEQSTYAMTDPAPSVLFKGFGESTLDFDLRFYIPNRDVWVDAVNDIHVRIDELFKQAGIEIAFPQRDLHLRSSDVSLSPKPG